MNVNHANPVKTNFMTGVMARISLDRQLKIMEEDPNSRNDILGPALQKFASIKDHIPESERQDIASKLTSFSTIV